MNLKKKNACRSLSADVSGTSCHAHNSFAKSRSCRCVILCNFSSQTWSLLLYVSKPFTAKKKKKKTQVCLWFAACACDDRFGSLSAHLNCIMFAARSSIHILHDFSSFFFFFLLKKPSFYIPSKDRITSICLFCCCLLFARRLFWESGWERSWQR